MCIEEGDDDADEEEDAREDARGDDDAKLLMSMCNRSIKAAPRTRLEGREAVRIDDDDDGDDEGEDEGEGDDEGDDGGDDAVEDAGIGRDDACTIFFDTSQLPISNPTATSTSASERTASSRRE